MDQLDVAGIIFFQERQQSPLCDRIYQTEPADAGSGTRSGRNDTAQSCPRTCRTIAQFLR
jgi:hypothetical protein